MKVLVINCGSSSLKYQVLEMDNEQLLCKGLVERIGIEGSQIKHEKIGQDKFVLQVPMKDHKEAIGHVMDALVDPEHGVVSSMKEIGAVGHRVVHAGEKYACSVVITEDVISALEECTDLAPLHNPANILGIRACQEMMPGVPMVGVFDTAFHQTMPEKAFLYGVPYKYYEEDAVRRYGFHGTSHRFVSGRAIELLGLNKGSRVIVAHLGNGSSLSAVVDGKCVDTSMGLTPLEGVLMGTRSGNVDPAVVEFIANKEGWTVTETLTMLNKKSGLLGISGLSSDMRDVIAMAAGRFEKLDENIRAKITDEEKARKRAQLTLDMWVYSIRKYIGAYAAAMGGLDALIFTAGIGENNPFNRELVCEGLEFMGIKLDPEKNHGIFGDEGKISADDSRVQVWVIPTNEELAIARDTLELAGK